MIKKALNINIPQHVAIIMDGNGRWAESRHMHRTFGHAKGAAVVHKLVEICAHKGVKYLTLFAFSTENWSRPEFEVSALMDLFFQFLERELSNLALAGVRFQVIGDITFLSRELQDRIAHTIKSTACNDRIFLTVAANYGGQWDIIQAIQHWQVDNSQFESKKITIEELAKYLSTSYMPDPDLLIRTGGEKRLSNFMIWQLAYAELYFTDVLWPEFDTEHLELALNWYQTRQRRYGGLN